MPAQSGFQHHFDLCDQHRIAGWTTAPSLIVAINDGPVARIVPDLPRPDLAEAGIGPGHGFAFTLPRPLWTDDDVSVHAEDGTGARTRLGFAAAQRVADLTRHADPARRIGLEIGPLDRPVVPKGRFRIYTLDQAPRRGLQLRFGGAGEPMTLLEEPDFVLGEGSFLDAVGDRRFDYAIASHVIEHVPDMIGWLWQVWSVLKDGAVLSLAVPHAEKIFDAHRRRTTLADLLDPYFGRAVRPGARQIVDAALGSALFYGNDVLQAAFDAFHRANHARKAGLYLDTHCSVFTPESFADTLRCLDRCELLGFDLPDIVYRGNDEFIAHLVKRAHKTLPDHISP
jgi:SAM-dependent methyltransferase